MNTPITDPYELPTYTVLQYYLDQEVYPPFQDYAQITLTNYYQRALQVKNRWETADVGNATIHRTNALPYTVRASEKFQQAYRHWSVMLSHGDE